MLGKRRACELETFVQLYSVPLVLIAPAIAPNSVIYMDGLPDEVAIVPMLLEVALVIMTLRETL